MQTRERGVTLIELLVVIAILTMVLAGIYTMMNSAYQTYLASRRRIESQQTVNIAADYLVFRLREIDGGPMTDTPWTCTNCHDYNVDGNGVNGDGAGNDLYLCQKDVSKPRRSLYIEELKTIALPQLTGLPASYQNMSGNFITFQADLLPLTGVSEAFTDNPNTPGGRIGFWDWTPFTASDLNADGLYSWPEPELLEDLNKNNQHDCFAETWTLQLRPSSSGRYYELVESLDFSSLRPNAELMNRSVYPTNTALGYKSYTSQVVAYGLTGVSIKIVPRVPNPTVKPGQSVVNECYDATQTCHGSGGTFNVYGDAADFDYVPFIATHPWWNVRGLSVEVSAASSNVQKEYFLKLKQFVIPRNLEINQR